MQLPYVPFKTEEGWYGAFTRNEVLGAWRNGSRVVKQNSEEGDARPDGTLGTVIGSFMNPGQVGRMIYFVEWDDAPKVAVATIDFKISPAS